MTDSRLNGLPVYNRVSIRAVLVHEGEDPAPALAAAGIVDPVAIRVVLGDDPHLAGGILGDGITPNLIAVLETEYGEAFHSSAANQSGRAGSQPDAAHSAEPATTTAPTAFGMRSLAPVGRIGTTAQAGDTSTGRCRHRARGYPPSPARGLQVDATVAAGGIIRTDTAR